MVRVADPVLRHLAARSLRREMPVESSAASRDRPLFSHLEALGRTLAGIAPWLEAGGPEADSYAALAREALDAISDPRSPDFGNFSHDSQPLVDAAFLAQGLVRAPGALWRPLDERVRRNLRNCLKSTRVILPGFNNWLLFSAMIEAAFYAFGETDWDRMRIDYALRQHDEWYLGDGVYGDGPHLCADYYNSFVIQPMLLDVLRQTAAAGHWTSWQDKMEKRAVRGAALLERLISPEGTFPPLGRSLAYRSGALQLLAQMALWQKLPPEMAPAQVRCALTAVMHRLFDQPGVFDANGWLTIGLSGSQPGLGEGYISTGSLYLCLTGFLPLGLPATDVFWAGQDVPWTAQRAWNGGKISLDAALEKRPEAVYSSQRIAVTPRG